MVKLRMLKKKKKSQLKWGYLKLLFMLLLTEDYSWCQESKILDMYTYFQDSESYFKTKLMVFEAEG